MCYCPATVDSSESQVAEISFFAGVKVHEFVLNDQLLEGNFLDILVDSSQVHAEFHVRIGVLLHCVAIYINAMLYLSLHFIRCFFFHATNCPSNPPI
jgi:hypothetical protein